MKPDREEPKRHRGADDPLYRERSSSSARSQEQLENHEANRLRAGHVRCGGGWWVRRKKIGGDG